MFGNRNSRYNQCGKKAMGYISFFIVVSFDFVRTIGNLQLINIDLKQRNFRIKYLLNYFMCYKR